MMLLALTILFFSPFSSPFSSGFFSSRPVHLFHPPSSALQPSLLEEETTQVPGHRINCIISALFLDGLEKKGKGVRHTTLRTNKTFFNISHALGHSTAVIFGAQGSLFSTPSHVFFKGGRCTCRSDREVLFLYYVSHDRMNSNMFADVQTFMTTASSIAMFSRDLDRIRLHFMPTASKAGLSASPVNAEQRGIIQRKTPPRRWKDLCCL